MSTKDNKENTNIVTANSFGKMELWNAFNFCFKLAKLLNLYHLLFKASLLFSIWISELSVLSAILSRKPAHYCEKCQHLVSFSLYRHHKCPLCRSLHHLARRQST